MSGRSAGLAWKAESFRPASLLLRSAMTEARVVIDPSRQFSKLAKNSEGGRRVRARDDAAAAAILAVAAGARHPAKPQRRWRYRGMV